MVGDDGAVQLSDAVPITTLPLQGATCYFNDELMEACQQLSAWAPPEAPVVVLGLPTLINAVGRWFPDAAPRCITTTLGVLSVMANDRGSTTVSVPEAGLTLTDAMRPTLATLLDRIGSALKVDQ